jgi:ATP-dependent RNA helicase RhlE
MSFSDLGLSEPILRAVTSEGYENPTPIQAQSIPHVMAGRDLLGCAQTGTGKTAAFALPILHRLTAEGNPPPGSGRKIRVLVLAPTRELALQISESFSSYGRNTPLRNTVIFGGVGQGNQVKALQRGVDILIATPGRLNDLMDQGYINLAQLQIFVLDEADRMLDIGFLPDIRRVMAKLPKVRQTLFFSATMPPEVRKLADDLLHQPAKVEIAPVKATADLIDQSVVHIPKAKKTRLLAAFLKQPGVDRSIVFARTKHGADRIARQLLRYGIRAEAIHGNKSQNARQRTLDRFRIGKLRVLLATDLAARGIDVDNITHVFNFDLPHEPETYVHRIGRTGRAGSAGKAIAFCDPAERSMLKGIERLTRKSIPVLEELPEPPEVTPEEQALIDEFAAEEEAFADGVGIHRPVRDGRRRHEEGERSEGGPGRSQGTGGPPRRGNRRRRPGGTGPAGSGPGGPGAHRPPREGRPVGAQAGAESTGGQTAPVGEPGQARGPGRGPGRPHGRPGGRPYGGGGGGGGGGSGGASRGPWQPGPGTAGGEGRGPRRPPRKGGPRRPRGRG